MPSPWSLIAVVKLVFMNNRDNDTKEVFYTALQEVVDNAPRGDKVVVMGDHKARMGNHMVRWEGDWKAR